MATGNGFAFHTSEFIAALVFILTAVGTLVAKSKGLITFGKPAERRECSKATQKVCIEHTKMTVDVSRLCVEVAEANVHSRVMRGEISDMNEKLDNLIIHHAIKNGKDLR